MARFTLTELNNKSGEVVEAAYEGPVTLTSRGKRKFVLMTAAQYDRLSGSSAQRVYDMSDLSDEERLELAEALEAAASANGGNDD